MVRGNIILKQLTSFSKSMYFFGYPNCMFVNSYGYLPVSSLFPEMNNICATTINSTPQTPSTPATILKTSFSDITRSISQEFRPKAPPKDTKLKTVTQDEDYRPDGSGSKKKLKMKQIENRNIIPNVVRLIISFIQKKGKSEVMITKLMGLWEKEQEWSVKRFYHYQGMLRNQLNNYVNEETLSFLVKLHPDMLDIYGQAEQQFYNRITRTLIYEFIRDDFHIHVLTSKRMDKAKRNLHLTALRNIRIKARQLLASQTNNL